MNRYRHIALVDQSAYSRIEYNGQQFHLLKLRVHDDEETMQLLLQQPYAQYKTELEIMSADSIHINDYRFHHLRVIDYLETMW